MASGGRNVRERAAPVQKKGFARGHYQRGEAPFLLFEAWPEAPGQAGAGPQARPEEITQGYRVIVSANTASRVQQSHVVACELACHTQVRNATGSILGRGGRRRAAEQHLRPT